MMQKEKQNYDVWLWSKRHMGSKSRGGGSSDFCMGSRLSGQNCQWDPLFGVLLHFY
jgi:hypothetical protein